MFRTITKVPLEIIQQFTADHPQITLRNYKHENQPIAFIKTTEVKTKKSLEVSPTEQNLDTIIRSQQMDNNPNETSEAGFISTLSDGGTLFSSHTTNNLSQKRLENNNKNKNKK